MLSRPCIYGVFSGRFGGFRPIKERCTGCMRCVQEFPDICRVERNTEFASFPDSYWRLKDPSVTSSAPVAIVCYEAETGKIPVKGMGYRGPFASDGWDSMWTDMSEIVRPTRDGVYGREYISTLVDIGRKPKFIELRNERVTEQSRTVPIQIPIVFDYLPPALNNKSTGGSVAAASKSAGTFFIASPKGADREDRFNGHIIPLITSTDFQENSETISRARIVEYVEDGSGLRENIRAVNGSAPVIARLPFKPGVEQAAVELVQDGADALHLFANYHGQEFDSLKPRFVKDLIRSAHTALVKEHLRDEVTLIVSGGITLAEHVPKAIICGADLVAIDTTVLVALQAKLEGECVSAETGRIRPDSFDARWGAQRLVNLLASWHDQLIEVLSAMGMRDVRRLRGDVGRGMFNEDLEKEAFADIPRRA